MKKIFESETTNKLLLMIISILLGVMVYFGKEQVDSTKRISERFSTFQIDVLKSNAQFDKSLQKTQIWTQDVYDNEIHPNTIRSKKNEKDIFYLKSDVNIIKSQIK